MRDEETTDMYRHAYLYLTDSYIITLRDFRYNILLEKFIRFNSAKVMFAKSLHSLSHSLVSYLRLCVPGYLNVHWKLK